MGFEPNLTDPLIPLPIMRYIQLQQKWGRDGTYDKAIDRAYVQKLCLREATSLTVNGGVISPNKAYHTLLCETGTTDDINTIAATNFSRGDILVLAPATAGDTITIKHNTGNIMITGGADVVLASTYNTCFLLWDGTYWVLIGMEVNGTATQGPQGLKGDTGDTGPAGAFPFTAIDESLADTAYYNLPTAKSGLCWVMIGENQETARFNFKNDGSVEMLENSINVETTDEADSLCILSVGTQVRIKNNLGSTLTLKGIAITA